MSILFPVAIVGVIGLIAGIGLAVASIIMATPSDEKCEAILEVLPGANCGGCGYSGCEGYAKAIAHDKEDITLCAPGGSAVADKIASILGVDASEMVKKGAFVLCQGAVHNTYIKATYNGIFTCEAASMYLDGPNRCSYGCVGFGDCAAACKYDAITIIDDLATVNLCKCVGCGVCAKACPKKIIAIKPVNTGKAMVLCSSKDSVAYTKSVCFAGCIGCKRCAKSCEANAITIENNLASIDLQKCTGCGKCHDVCPVKAIGI